MSEDDIVCERVHARGLHLARVLCTTRSVSLVSRRVPVRVRCRLPSTHSDGAEMAKFAATLLRAVRGLPSMRIVAPGAWVFAWAAKRNAFSYRFINAVTRATTPLTQPLYARTSRTRPPLCLPRTRAS